ncbi:MAG TPA: hypothetical protein VLK23_10100 [Thermodesulfobacteriota bacterium]|nr:hypothetical protein [Thermodesulfobacteriota bacterium]
MKRFKVEISKGPFRIHGHIQELGQDLLVSIWGGTKPHIGAVGVAIPRPSLRGPRKWSATSSNFTFVGHKEDILVKKISERLASQLKTNVVVIAGIHWDDISNKEIKVIENLTEKLQNQILRRLRGDRSAG